MALKKSQLYSSIWQACDELRGGMDASQYKDYVLALLFVRYVSDRYGGDNSHIVLIPAGGSFDDLTKLKGDPNIGEGINTVLSTLAEANSLRGVIDAVNFNDEDKLGKGKEMVDRLSNLVAIFEKKELDFSKNKADGDDLLGDAYEYLMKHFAVESGKSKGQFYTPAEVSRIIAKVVGASKDDRFRRTAYDPTCGSGSLLLKVASEAPHGLTMCGQELDNATAALAIMNMWLHGEPYAEIKKGQSTLSDPQFKKKDGSLKTFDYVVANPPFSYKSWSNGFNPEQDLFERFTNYGIPPKKNGDYAFLLHIVRSMKSTGKGAVVLPHGVLFRGNAEAEIRQNLIKHGYIKGIIGLPANLFYGTGIPACIIVLDKEGAEDRKSIFMIDASKGFVKDGNKNRLREQDIHKIVDVFTKQIELPKFSRLVPLTEIEEKEYNLNLPRYIDSQEEEDLQDIEAHLKGGIPNTDIEALEKYWTVYPTLKKTLFTKSSRDGYSILNIGEDEINQAVFDHSEFKAYGEKTGAVFSKWSTKHKPLLETLNEKVMPKQLIANISEDLLADFANLALIDKYDIYQHLMSYWNETMQDDVYLITADGWGTHITASKNNKGKQTGWDSDLIPKELVIARYFSKEQLEIDELQTQLDEVSRQIEELAEEHGGDEGMLNDVTTDSGKLSKSLAVARMREIKDSQDDIEELALIHKFLELNEQEVVTKKQIKTAEENLDRLLLTKYQSLTEEEIKQLVVDDKWLATLEELVKGELDRISQRLTQRIKQLADRYHSTLPELENEVQELAKKVEGHLNKMGFEV